MLDRPALFSLVLVMGLKASGPGLAVAIPLPKSDLPDVTVVQGAVATAVDSRTDLDDRKAYSPDLWRSLLIGGLGVGAIALLFYQIGRRHGKQVAVQTVHSLAPVSEARGNGTAQAAAAGAVEEKATLDSPPLTPTRLSKVEATQSLVNHLHHADPNLRRQAIWQLGQQGTTEAVQPLIDLMIDADSQQRSLILAAISEIGVRTLTPLSRALLLSLQDESAEVRQNAVRDIARIYDLMAQVSQVLRYATEDADASVRETACWALGQLSRIHSPPVPAAIPTSVEQQESETPS